MILPTSKNIWVRRALHIGIILGLAYLDFVSCWELGYREIYCYHSHKVAISLWCLVGITQSLVLWYWGLQVFYGPGECMSIKPYDLYDERNDSLTPMPEYFFCDDYGYPNWCLNCQSIKLPRARHMKHLQRCVPKTDHFCLWVGTVLGKRNYVVFIKYLLWFDSFFIIILTYMAIYTRSNISKGAINNNFIVGFILGGMWVILILALLGSHLYYISVNMTTLDDVHRKHAKKANRPKIIFPWEKPKPKPNPINHKSQAQEQFDHKPSQDPNKLFLNVLHNHERLIIETSIHKNIFNHGMKINWINLFLFNNSIYLHQKQYYSTLNLFKAIIVFLVPIIDIFFKHEPNDIDDNGIPTLSHEFKNHIIDKINNEKSYLPLYIKSFEPKTSSL